MGVARPTILCVEDDPLVREVTQTALERAGCVVLVAVNGAEAVDQLRSRPGDISLVLLDWVVPGGNSADTIVALRRIRPDLRILLTSGYAHVGGLPVIANKQVQGFIQKPYLPAQLLRKIRHLLAAERQAANA